MGKFNLMSLDEAKEKSTEPGYIVVDLRSEKEYYSSHIENAMNIPMATVEKIECFNKKNTYGFCIATGEVLVLN